MESDPEMTHMLKLAGTNFSGAIITMCKDIHENMLAINKGMK